jgi:hypothetical protein
MIVRSFLFGVGAAFLFAVSITAKASSNQYAQGFCKTPTANNQKFQISGTLSKWDPDISGLFTVADESGPTFKYWMLAPLTYEQEQQIARAAGSQVTLSVKCLNFNEFDYVSLSNL